MPKGIKSASSKISQLDALGSSKSDFDVAEGNDIIMKAAGRFIQRVQKNLKRQNKWVTGKTAELRIVQSSDGKTISIVAPESLEYLDKGVSGTQTKYNTPYAYTNKMPPPSIFAEWIRRSNKNLLNNAKYKGKESALKELTEEERINQAAFGMAINHKKHGQKPLNVYTDEIQQLKDEMKKEFKYFVVKTIINGFKK